MKIKYKCRCMDNEREIAVRSRQHDEDLLLWMGVVVQTTISGDHAVASPYCLCEKMQYVKIPTDENASGIGMEVVKH